MPNHPAPPPVAGLVPAVARALAVLDLLAREHQPLSMARVAATLDLPKSSVHGLCNTLLHFGYLRRSGNGALQIGPGVMSLAEAFVSSTSVVSEFDALWREAGSAPDETLILSVLNGAEVIYVGVRPSPRPLGLTFNVGMRLPAHLAATGKAMLAFLDSAAGVPAELAAELTQTRERGFSIDDGGVHEAIYAIGAPVFDASGQPVAGMAVCLNKAGLSADKLARQREIVVQAARRLSRRLGARTENP